MTALDVSLLQRRLPKPLHSLAELALDLRWTWSHSGDALWSALDSTAWELTQNPWFILQRAPEERLEALAKDPSFLDELERLTRDRAAYLALSPAVSLEGTVAYFSLEFGLGSAVPLYAGGLGVLAGDYMKTASDLALPVVGVGILYQEGYFRQSIDGAGNQHEAYPYNEPSTLPIQPALAPDGSLATISVPLPGRSLWLRVWRARVGRVDLYLLDANEPINSAADRGITAKLYAGDDEARLLQRIVLGIGGPRALAALGIDAAVAHLNEGHAAFVALERAHVFALAEHATLHEAIWATRAGNVFTTHTPVQASFDTFPVELMRKYFSGSGEYMSAAQFSVDEFLEIGRKLDHDEMGAFSMPHFALRCSARTNGVSRAHAQVSRRLFAACYPRWPEREVPIREVTNGVHVPSWDSPAADELWTRACGKGRWLGSLDQLCAAICTVSDADLWALRAREREVLVQFARNRLREHLARRGEVDVERAGSVFDPNVLTLGVARRFTEYKRPNLLLTDPDRLARMLCSQEHPAQIVLAGKAHPDDAVGKAMISAWISFVSRPEVRDRAVFLEDYDMRTAEEIVRGVDVWINTPRAPFEACGTSGMKVLANGGLNVSALDGWWAEAWKPEVGWALENGSRTDAQDAERLYSLLEHEVIPEFYDRDAFGIPLRWVARIRASVSELTPSFSSNRMARAYAERYYAPAIGAVRRRIGGGGRLAKDLARWSDRVRTHWHQIHFGAPDIEVTSGGFRFRIGVYLGELDPESVAVELCADGTATAPSVTVSMVRDGALQGATNAHVYEATVVSERTPADFTARVVPFHPEAVLPTELPLILWQH